MFKQTGAWYRQGNFYKRKIGAGSLTNSVSFINPALGEVRELSVLRYTNNFCRIDLRASSPSNYKKLVEVLHLFLENNFEEKKLIVNLVSMTFNGDTLLKLLEVFRHVNQKHGYQVFSKELIAELRDILSAISGDEKDFYNKTHNLPEGKIANAYVNPNLKNSSMLVETLKYSSSDTVKKLKKCLVNGHDTNKTDIIGWSPLMYAIISNNLDLVCIFFAAMLWRKPFSTRN